ncbi:MAG: GtrA family protein [Novosphingobium sp.]
MARTGNNPPRLLGFALISGIGWILDFAIFTGLVAAGTSVFIANMISAITAVLFVFFASRQRLFEDATRPLGQAITLYVLYNVVAVTVASLLIQIVGRLLIHGIDLLAHQDRDIGADGLRLANAVAPMTAKILVTPLTMYANFVASAYINLRRLRLF